MIEGPECEYQQKIENEIYQLLQKLYSKNTRTEAWFSTWVGKQISQEQAAWLERQFAKGEIKMAVFFCSKQITGTGWFYNGIFPRKLGYYKVRIGRSISRIPNAWESFQGPKLKSHQPYSKKKKKKELTEFKT